MNDNISLEEEHNLQLGDQSLEIKIDTTDKLGFIVDSMPHLIRHAHKCVQNSSPDDYSCERELVIYNWMVRLEQLLRKEYDNQGVNLDCAEMDEEYERENTQKIKDAKEIVEKLKDGDPYWKELKEKVIKK
jgi:hypothetical protein